MDDGEVTAIISPSTSKSLSEVLSIVNEMRYKFRHLSEKILHQVDWMQLYSWGGGSEEYTSAFFARDCDEICELLNLK